MVDTGEGEQVHKMTLEEWIAKAEEEAGKQERRARTAGLLGDGHTESAATAEEVNWRILCGFLWELYGRRLSEGSKEDAKE